MKTWTRPKINVQKFVPNFCVVNCYFDFFEGEAWVDDSFRGEKKIWDDYDIYNANWLGTTADGKKSIKVDSGEIITSYDAFKRKLGGTFVPIVDDYDDDRTPRRTFFDYDLEVIEHGEHNSNTVYYVITNATREILARSYNQTAS